MSTVRTNLLSPRHRPFRTRLQRMIQPRHPIATTMMARRSHTLPALGCRRMPLLTKGTDAWRRLLKGVDLLATTRPLHSTTVLRISLHLFSAAVASARRPPEAGAAVTAPKSPPLTAQRSARRRQRHPSRLQWLLPLAARQQLQTFLFSETDLPQKHQHTHGLPPQHRLPPIPLLLAPQQQRALRHCCRQHSGGYR